MSPADGIRRLGFRRWYERQLIESHACFLTCFLCAILATTCVEGVSLSAGGWSPLAMLALVFGAGAIGIAALKRYKRILDRAEHIAERAVCGRCTEYGRIRVISASGLDMDAAATPWLRVECRKCGHQWLIE